MIIYQVNCEVHQSVANKWEKYFVEKHLDDVLNTGCFSGYSFRKGATNGEFTVFSSEYYCPSEADLERYNQEFAPLLKEDISSKFSGQYSCYRHIYTSIVIKKHKLKAKE